MAASKQQKLQEAEQLGPRGFRLFARFAFFFINIFPFFLNIVVIVQLMRANYRAYHRIDEYLGNSLRLYGGDAANGYVDYSTIPKQSGGYVWTIMFHIAILIWIAGAIAAEAIVWPPAQSASIAVLSVLQLKGLNSGSNDSLAATMFYKIFLCTCLFSQSFQPLDQFNNSPTTANDNVLPDTFSWRIFAIWTTYTTLLSSLLSILTRVYAYNDDKKLRARPTATA